MQPMIRSVVLFLLFTRIGAAVAFAVSPDARLLRLVPPESQIVAGMRAPSAPGQPGNFLLITHKNTVDLSDFYALTGADRLRVIGQVVFVAGPGKGNILNEHSLLVSGDFDAATIFRTAGSGARATEYRGVSLLIVPPFERERAGFRDLRWLAIPDPHVTIFGTAASVEKELDLYLDEGRVEPPMATELSRLRRDDDSWCLVKASLPSEISGILVTLDPRLANLGAAGKTFEFGIRYGNQVEFDYEVDEPTLPVSGGLGSAHDLRFTASNAKGSSLFARAGVPDVGETRGLIKIPKRRYEQWLENIAARGRSRNAVSVSRPLP